MNKSTIWIIAKYLLAVGVLAFVLYLNWEPDGGGGIKDVWDRHAIQGEPIDGTFLLLAVLLHLTSLTTIMYRWYVLVRAQDLPFTFLNAVRLGTLGFLWNAFLPGAVGGDLIKAAVIARGQSRQTVAVATVIMDRAMSLWGLIFSVAVVGSSCWATGALFGSALEHSQALIISCDVVVGITMIVWIMMGVYSLEKSETFAVKLSRVPKIGSSLAQLWQAMWLYRYRPAGIVWAVVLSTISNMCEAVAFYCYARTLWDGLASNPLPGLVEHCLLVPVGLVINGIPLFPGGAGIGEAGFGGLYRLFDSAPANGVLASMLFRVTILVLAIMGYLASIALDRTPPQTLATPADGGTGR